MTFEDAEKWAVDNDIFIAQRYPDKIQECLCAYIAEVEKLRAELEQAKIENNFNPPITCIDCCSDVAELKAEIENNTAILRAAEEFESELLIVNGWMKVQFREDSPKFKAFVDAVRARNESKK